MASKRRIRRKKCGSKRRYLTAQDALAGMHKLHRAKGYQGFMDVYRCEFCNGYHFGHHNIKWRKSA